MEVRVGEVGLRRVNFLFDLIHQLNPKRSDLNQGSLHRIIYNILNNAAVFVVTSVVLRGLLESLEVEVLWRTDTGLLHKCGRTEIT